MTILKHGDTPECVRYVCGNCGYEWKALEIHVYNKASNETRYFRDCPECGKIRVEGERRNKQ